MELGELKARAVSTLQLSSGVIQCDGRFAGDEV